MSKRDELRRLHFVNSLFAHVTGRDLYLAEQIKAAIAFSLAELKKQTDEHPDFAQKYDSAFTSAAAQLLEKFFHEHEKHGFYHWDAAKSLEASTPLFARNEVMTGLKHLTPYDESTLLITNLRPALLPADKRATPKRVRDYEELLAFIRELAAARTPRNAKLHLLFL